MRIKFSLFLTALLVAAADQLTKEWIRSNLATGQAIPESGLFQITHVHNTGAAFGLLSDQSSLLAMVAAIGVVLLLIYALFLHHRLPFLNNRPASLALGLILGGTIGNLFDRLLRGYVTDFISVGIWPDFNIADSAITIGAIILAYSLLQNVRAEE
ncbi:MAG: signal peptidase II [Chloroflexi bacterium]|nr:signal peptidase II [Chloroflexota bacterium]